MIVDIVNSDIVDFQADALIYSTNKELLLSGGGVGAALVQKYGYVLQDAVFKLLAQENKTEAVVGDVFDCSVPGVLWKKIMHTLVSDDNYSTCPDVVRRVLIRCFEICDQAGDIESIVLSALGCGYGDLSHKDFVKLVQEVADGFDATHIKRVTICCKNTKFYQELLSAKQS